MCREDLCIAKYSYLKQGMHPVALVSLYSLKLWYKRKQN